VLRVDKRARPEADGIRLGYVIVAALRGTRGREEIAAAERRLNDLIARERFNSARAVDIYAVAVDRAVWASLKGTRERLPLYRSYKASGLRETCGRQLTEAFKSKTGAKEQPPGVMRSVLVGLGQVAHALSRLAVRRKAE
jgi:hypothetical protein